MNKIVKNIVLCVLCAAGLITTGVYAINAKNDVETKQSSYTLTKFDYVITSPSKEQVDEFNSAEEAVDSLFPCYAFDSTLTGSTKSKTMLLLSDDMSDYSVGLFNDSTKLSGDYDESGIMLDQTAATKLGAKVGDSISTTLANVKFDFTVSAIYMASSYRGFDNGLALAKYSDSISSAFARELSYDYAFISAKDSAKCAELLKDYIPLGPLQSQEEYVNDYKAKNNCPPSMTEEEWNNSIVEAYAEYKATYLGQKFKNVVQNKADYMADINDRVNTAKQGVTYLCVGIAIAVVVLYALISMALIYSNKANDSIDSKNGKSNLFLPYYKVTIFGTLSISLAAGLALFIYGTTTHFLEAYVGIILCFCLPVLVSLIAIIPFIVWYSSKITAAIKQSKTSDK